MAFMIVRIESPDCFVSAQCLGTAYLWFFHRMSDVFQDYSGDVTAHLADIHFHKGAGESCIHQVFVSWIRGRLPFGKMASSLA